jgi:LPS export ABC transporter protein LptC
MEIRYFRIKIFLLAGMAIGLSILSISLYAAFEKQNVILPKAFPLMNADIQIQDFAFIQTQDDYNEWKIKAQRAEVFEDQKQAVLQGLQVEFRLPEGLGMTFHGKQGKLDTQNHDFEIFSSDDRDIEVTFNNGYKIATRSLKWANQEQRILTSDPVQIHGPGLKIYGQGLEAYLASQELKVLSDVHAVIF